MKALGRVVIAITRFWRIAWIAPVLLVLLASCEKPTDESEPNIPSQKQVQVLNKTADYENPSNPFSVAIMRQAYDSLRRRQQRTLVNKPSGIGSSNATTGDFEFFPTHRYVRFRPASVDQLADLDEAGYRLSWEPFDETVAAYTTVDYTSSTIPWIYSVVPSTSSLPLSIQTEILQDLFLYNEDDADIQDEDPWEPDPIDPCAPHYDPACNCMVQCRTSQVASSKPNITKQTTEKLKKAGISPSALYNEAMRITHHEEEMLPEMGASGQQRLSNTRYYPSGTIRVQENEMNQNIPVPNVRVESRRWFKLGGAYTTANGSYNINTGYRGKARIFVEFKNGFATTRGFINSLKVWEAVLPIKAGLGLYENSNMQNVNYTFTYQADASSVGARSWVAASLFSVLTDIRPFAQSRGIIAPPTNLNIWLHPDPSKGSTPMLRYIANTSAASTFIDYILASSSLFEIVLAKQIMQRQLPDITIAYKSDAPATLNSYRLVKLFYHELGHSQHYAQVGNGFWGLYIDYIVRHFGYGTKSSTGSSRIALSEGWGNYVEGLYAIDRYQTTAPNAAATALVELEYQIPGNGNSPEWFVYGMMHDMTDATEPVFTGVTDNVNAYSTAMIFNGLRSNVASVRDFESQVLLQNNQLQAPALNQLVTAYGW